MTLTIKQVTLNSEGSLVLTTNDGRVINSTPRIPLDQEVVFTPEVSTALLACTALNLVSDLTDRVQHLESRLSELVTFIRNVAAVTGNNAPTAEAETTADPADTATEQPTPVTETPVSEAEAVPIQSVSTEDTQPTANLLTDPIEESVTVKSKLTPV